MAPITRSDRFAMLAAVNEAIFPIPRSTPPVTKAKPRIP